VYVNFELFEETFIGLIVVQIHEDLEVSIVASLFFIINDSLVELKLGLDFPVVQVVQMTVVNIDH
jgi:hypothetical protein